MVYGRLATCIQRAGLVIRPGALNTWWNQYRCPSREMCDSHQRTFHHVEVEICRHPLAPPWSDRLNQPCAIDPTTACSPAPRDFNWMDTVKRLWPFRWPLIAPPAVEPAENEPAAGRTPALDVWG